MVLIGRLTKDAVVSQLKDERQVVNFTIAMNDNYKPKGSDKWIEHTTFFNCAYWISTKVAERLKKGNLVEVCGRLYVNAYKDVQGEAKASINCNVSTIKVHQQMESNVVETETKTKEKLTDDLPF